MSQSKLCNMLKNAKFSLLQVYEIDYFWSTWLLDASEGCCNLSKSRWPLVLQPPGLAVKVLGAPERSWALLECFWALG